jgi:hypothetical protein
MLTKHTNIEIPKDNPFANDKLDRKKIIENLTMLVQSTNQPFVISVEAPWGWGKTTFINIWKTHLETLGHPCLYFNAWENDFVEDPLIAFIGEIGKALVDKKAKGKARTQLKKLQNIGGKIVRRSIPLAIQIATQGLLTQEAVKKASDVVFTSSDEIASFASELAEEKIKQYENDKNGIFEFKKELAEFAKFLSEDESKKAPLVFFIDELDRCRPDFSISLLERIKHVFSVEGVVFILGLDREQIEQSVRSIYGQDMKSDGYLRRFIDFRLRLPAPSTENFCNFLFERFKMNEVFEGRKDRHNEQDTLMRLFVKLAQIHRFSLRVIEQCFTEINLILRTTSLNTRLFPDILAFLVALRAYKPETYAVLKGTLSYPQAEKLINEIKQDLDLKDRLCWYLSASIEAHIYYGYLDERERNNIFQNYQAVVESETDSKEDKEYAVQVMSFIQEFEWNRRYSHTIRFISSRLDAIEGILA